MRITNNMTYRSLLAGMQQRTQGQFEAQQALTSGVKFQHARDNPVAASSVLKAENKMAVLDSQQSNLNIVEARTAHAETRLGDMADVLQTAREMLVRSQTVAINTEDRAVLAEEMRNLAADVASIGNTRAADGRPLFSGTSQSLPFAGSAGAWSLDASMSAPIQVEVAAGRNMPAGVDVREAFVDSTGTVDLASLLEGYADTIELNPTDDPGKQARRDAIDAGLTEMDAVLDRVTFARSKTGLALESIDAIREAHASEELVTQDKLSSLRDADIAEEITRLSNENASLEAARAVFQRLEQQSLFNYL